MERLNLTNKQWMYYGMGLLLILIYCYLSFFAPQNLFANTFSLNQLQVFFLKFIIAISFITTWILAVYGLSILHRYITLAKEKENPVIPLLRSLRTGLIWIVLGSIFFGFVGVIKSYFIPNTAVVHLFTIVANYLLVFPFLIGFITMYRGALIFQSTTEMSTHKHSSYLSNSIMVFIISLFYIFLIFTNPSRQFSFDPAVSATYYLPDVLILSTIVLPTIIAWWLGFYASFTISNLIPYLSHTEIFKGITRILYGIWSIIFTSIIIQALTSFGEARLNAIGLGALLLLIYVSVFLQGIGYLFVALGSNVLQKSLK